MCSSYHSHSALTTHGDNVVALSSGSHSRRGRDPRALPEMMNHVTSTCIDPARISYRADQAEGRLEHGTFQLGTFVCLHLSTTTIVWL